MQMRLLPPIDERRRLFGRNLRIVSVALAIMMMATTAEHEPLVALGYWLVLGFVFEWSRVVERNEKNRG